MQQHNVTQLRHRSTPQLCFDCIEKRDLNNSCPENIDTSLSVRTRQSAPDCPEEILNIVRRNSIATDRSGYSSLEENEALSVSSATLLRDISKTSERDESVSEAISKLPTAKTW